MSARVESAAEAAASPRAHWELGGGGLLLGRPPDESLDDVEPLIERALAAAATRASRGQAVTPFVLSYLHRESGGRTPAANSDLIGGTRGSRARSRQSSSQRPDSCTRRPST